MVSYVRGTLPHRRSGPPASAGSLSVTVDGNNHITTSGFGYDAAGNMTQDGTGNTYTFDAENRLTQASGMEGGPYCYVYDGDGLRVAKIAGGSGSTCTGGTVLKLYWRSLSGDALAETDGTGSTTNSSYNEYVFFAGRRVASRNGSGDIFYWIADQVGTIRSITTGNGPSQTSGQLCYDADFTPYGQEMDHSENLQTTACPPNYRFTGYEYDSETGLYYAFARYYSPRLGRFLSTDPLAGAIGDLQSNNGYAYVVNNPSNFVDPTGQYVVGPPGTPGGAPGGPDGDPDNPFNPVQSDPMALYGYAYVNTGPGFIPDVGWRTVYQLQWTQIGIYMPASSGGGGKGGGGKGGGGGTQPQTRIPSPEQKQAACEAQYQQSISNATTSLINTLITLAVAQSIPADLVEIGCLGTGPGVLLCESIVGTVLEGPLVAGVALTVHNYNKSATAANQALAACKTSGG